LGGNRAIGRTPPGFASEGTRSLSVAVLSRDLDVFAQKVDDDDQIQGRGCDDDLWNGIVRSSGREGGVRGTFCSPVLGSRVASLRVLISARFASRVAGFILKLPPTKNWRVMVVGSQKLGGCGNACEKDMIAVIGLAQSSDSRIDRTSHQLAPYSDAMLNHFCRTKPSKTVRPQRSYHPAPHCWCSQPLGVVIFESRTKKYYTDMVEMSGPLEYPWQW
jgi:hypothetical protein